MAAEGGIFTYIFTGEEERDERGRYIIPQNVTHLLFHESVTAIPAFLFYEHPNIVEVYCHAGVERIERLAFYNCPRLRRVIIPGVEVVEEEAFLGCEVVTEVECPKLEIIGDSAFSYCKSLNNLNLPSAKVVGSWAFDSCEALTEAKFGKNLESIGRGAFFGCPSLERITIPLKNGLITTDDIFQGCFKLKCVDLVEREVLRDTITALHLEEWRNDVNAQVDSINRIVSNARARDLHGYDNGEKSLVIRGWITRVLRKISLYTAEHRRMLNEIASELQRTLQRDIVVNNVVPFLELPSSASERA